MDTNKTPHSQRRKGPRKSYGKPSSSSGGRSSSQGSSEGRSSSQGSSEGRSYNKGGSYNRGGGSYKGGSSSKPRHGKRPFNKGGKPSGRPNRPQSGGPQKRKHKNRIPSAVKELATNHKLSLASAFRVSQNKISLEDAIREREEKEARREKARKICEKYPKINFALACLLVKENCTPEEYHEQKKEREKKALKKELDKRKKMQQDDKQKSAFSALVELSKNKVEIQLAKYGSKTDVGYIQEFTPYDFYFFSKERKHITRTHRLELKYFCEKEHASAVTKMIPVDKGLSKKRLRPSHGQDGRYKIPEVALRKGNELILALHEGEMVRGKIVWFTPFDILLEINKKKVWVFRHAVMDCAIGRRAPQNEKQ